MTDSAVLALVQCQFEPHGQAILDIFNQAILHTTALYEYQPRTLIDIKRWFEHKNKANLPVIGLVDADQQLLGFASFGSFRPQAAFLYTVEHSIYIQQDQQGKGLGKLLLQAIIVEAKKQKFHSMIASIDSSNIASIALHQKFNFQQAGVIQQAAYKFDRWLDLVFYQLILNHDE